MVLYATPNGKKITIQSTNKSRGFWSRLDHPKSQRFKQQSHYADRDFIIRIYKYPSKPIAYLGDNRLDLQAIPALFKQSTQPFVTIITVIVATAAVDQKNIR